MTTCFQSSRWNNATSVTVPEGLQRIHLRVQWRHELIDLVDKERRYQQECNRAQILIADVNYRTQTGMAELERRLQRHLCGSLRYEYMITSRLLSIASARGIEVPYDTALNEPDRVQLIELISDSDAAAGPFNLLQLPAELREQILGYAVLPEYETSSSPGPVLPDFPPLMFVNKQLRREAGKIFMRSCQIVLPCTANLHVPTTNASGSRDFEISAPESTLVWLREAGVDLLPSIDSCLLVYRIPQLMYRSYVYAMHPIDGTSVYSTRLLGVIQGHSIFDTRGLYLLNLPTEIQSQLNLDSEEVRNIRLNETKAKKIVESFQRWEEQTGEDVHRSKFYGAAVLLNWL